MDLNKEIKLSDLFKRRPKATEEGEGTEPEAAADERKGEGLRRELRLPFRRRSASGEPEAPKKPKEARLRRPRGRRSSAPALPAVPLMRAFNLMPREDARQAAGGRRPSTVQLALAVVGLVLVAGLASFFLITNARVADKQRKHDDLRAELAAKNVRAAEPAPAGDPTLVQERDQRRSALATALGSRIGWDRLLREFSLVLPDDVWLKSLKATSGTPPDAAAPVAPNAQPVAASSFEISGYSRKPDDVAVLLSRMAVLPELESVQLLSATKTKIGKQDVVEFNIRASVKARSAGGTA
jgi:Tfp pilus assembly protein PilN